jgi:hypothetical protein
MLCQKWHMAKYSAPGIKNTVRLHLLTGGDILRGAGQTALCDTHRARRPEHGLSFTALLIIGQS